jgi:flagellar M-ring protein FliF
MKAILEFKGGGQSAAAVVGSAEQAQAQAQLQGAAPAASAGPSLTAEGQPNLIADLTEKLGRTPLKRLEQMIDYDEDQAAAILKQWMRGAERA